MSRLRIALQCLGVSGSCLATASGRHGGLAAAPRTPGSGKQTRKQSGFAPTPLIETKKAKKGRRGSDHDPKPAFSGVLLRQTRLRSRGRDSCGPEGVTAFFPHRRISNRRCTDVIHRTSVRTFFRCKNRNFPRTRKNAIWQNGTLSPCLSDTFLRAFYGVLFA
jgi:hypothetical protein